MFIFEGSMKFVNIDTDYVRALHDVCDEYKPIPNSKDDVKHILSAIDIKKMIPVRDQPIPQENYHTH